MGGLEPCIVGVVTLVAVVVSEAVVCVAWELLLLPT